MICLLNKNSILCKLFPLFCAILASFGSNINFSGEKLYAMIILGYNEAKSNPVTGLLFSIPFLGGNTYIPGYFPFSTFLGTLVLITISHLTAYVPRRFCTFIPFA